jgi:Carboxypeptidase regulatory-like domain
MTCRAKLARDLEYLLASLIFCGTVAVVAQTINGAFHGTVTDPSGGAIPGAKVVIRNLSNGEVRQAVTNSVGYYTITKLPPGHSSVVISKAGFTTLRQPDVELLVNQDLDASYSLTVDRVTQ